MARQAKGGLKDAPKSGPRDARTHGQGPARALTVLALALGAAWLAGFLWFAAYAAREAPLPPRADGIVVLTGGASRIAAALDLLRRDRAGMLLISGVAPGTEFATVVRANGGDPAALAGRVTLGRTATDTLGNAAEAAAWARAHRLSTLIVVTASYHMKRALVEIGRALPEARLYPAPVVPPALRGRPSLGRLRLLAAEYTKYLAATLGLTRLPRADANA